MLKVTESELRKEHQVLMVNKTTSFKRNGKGKKGNSKKSGKPVANPTKKPKDGPKPEQSVTIARVWVTGSAISPSIWLIRRRPKKNQVYLIYMLLMCT